MSLLCPWVSILKVVSCLLSFPATRPSPAKNPKLSPLVKTTSPSWTSQSLKASVAWPRTTINLVNSTLPASLPLPVVFPKLLSPSKLMPMVFWMSMPRTQLPVNLRVSLSPMIKVVCPSRTSRRWSVMLKSSRDKIKKWKKRLRHKTRLKLTASQSEPSCLFKTWLLSTLLLTGRQSNLLLLMVWLTLPMLLKPPEPTSKWSKEKLSLDSTLLWHVSTKLLVPAWNDWEI